jgi:NhaP-type Na+/H+ or K+/H+ antiporter
MLIQDVIMLASIGVVSLICQWVAWRLRLPAILFLLLAGILLGPSLGYLNPDALFGDLLLPIVTLAVAVILFEGSLTLKFSELQEHGRMVRNLLIIGVLVTWVVATLAAYLALPMSLSIAALFGAIVVVSGPTVIMPLLRAVRPNASINNILKWEGIVVDPIGALLAVLVFEFVRASSSEGAAFAATFKTFGITVLLGTSLGCAAGYLLGQALRKHWLPHFLFNAGTLTFMLGVFAFSNYLEHESGLLTVTVMGIWLANMKGVPVDEILEFKESLSVLLISGLFIILAAQIELEAIYSLGVGAIVVLAALLFIARPAAVFLSAIGTDLSWQEKTFLSWIAPRGIVAAAVSALFAHRLEQKGIEEASMLVPLIFSVIIVTVVLQSFSARIFAQALGVREPDSNGFIFIGANPMARMLAKAFNDRGIHVTLCDSNWENLRAARMENLSVYYGNPASEHAENNLDLTGIGHMLAISPYRQMNTHAVYHYLDLFEAGKVMAFSEAAEQTQKANLQAAEKFSQNYNFFEAGLSYAKLASLVSKGATVKTTQLSEAFSYDDYLAKHNGAVTPLFALPPTGGISPLGSASNVQPSASWEIIALVNAPNS